MAEKKRRKAKPQPPEWFWDDTDYCWCCKNKNNCGNCKLLKKYVAHQKENNIVKKKERN